MDKTIPVEDESNVTDIELMPDGRIFVFGTSLQVLDVLNELQTARDGEISARLDSCQTTPTDQNMSCHSRQTTSANEHSKPSEPTS